MKKSIILFTLSLLLSGCTLTNLMAKGRTNKKITILEQTSLDYPKKNGIEFFGISDLAYDAKKRKLYMIGDRSTFYTFSATFDKQIKNLKYLSAHKIKNSKNKSNYDSEGLTLNGKNELLISFEGQAKITNLSKSGKVMKAHTLPKKLRPKANYKSKNKMLESIAYHPKYGVLTAAEYPLKKSKKNMQTIYSLKGQEWYFKMEKHPNSAITALEVMDDNNILVLERAYNGYRKPMFVSLKKVYLNKCNSKRVCKSELLASFSSDEGYGYDNFEGLAKVGKNRYLMVSDNNGHDILPTTLTYFKVNP
ncbi:MAG: esterase-like activity of phytase family protein [Sulfurovaceae bacterium]|nr:esterase-like activity of phytase family protein [Sulfurovaceae bacterium]